MLACKKIIFLNVIDPLKTWWLIYVPPGLRQRNSTLLYGTCLLFVDQRTNSDFCAIQHYLTVFFMNQNQCVYCVVRTDTLRIVC